MSQHHSSPEMSKTLADLFQDQDTTDHLRDFRDSLGATLRYPEGTLEAEVAEQRVEIEALRQILLFEAEIDSESKDPKELLLKLIEERDDAAAEVGEWINTPAGLYKTANEALVEKVRGLEVKASDAEWWFTQDDLMALFKVYGKWAIVRAGGEELGRGWTEWEAIRAARESAAKPKPISDELHRAIDMCQDCFDLPGSLCPIHAKVRESAAPSAESKCVHCGHEQWGSHCTADSPAGRVAHGITRADPDLPADTLEALKDDAASAQHDDRRERKES